MNLLPDPRVVVQGFIRTKGLILIVRNWHSIKEPGLNNPLSIESALDWYALTALREALGREEIHGMIWRYYEDAVRMGFQSETMLARCIYTLAGEIDSEKEEDAQYNELDCEAFRPNPTAQPAECCTKAHVVTVPY